MIHSVFAVFVALISAAEMFQLNLLNKSNKDIHQKCFHTNNLLINQRLFKHFIVSRRMISKVSGSDESQSQEKRLNELSQITMVESNIHGVLIKLNAIEFCLTNQTESMPSDEIRSFVALYKNMDGIILGKKEEDLRKELEYLRKKEEDLRKKEEDLRAIEKMLHEKDLLKLRREPTQGEIGDLAVQMKKFAAACRNPIHIISSKSIEVSDILKLESLPDQITKKTYFVNKSDGENVMVEAFLLPKNINFWPSFLSTTKQSSAPCTDIYIRRMRMHNINRTLSTIELLKKSKNVAWLGSPGISKSTDMNFVLMELIRHLGDDGWPSIVTYRVGPIILEFKWSDNDVVVSEFPGNHFNNVDDYVNRFKSLPRNKRPVLLLDMKESESDPDFYIPMLVTQSSRDADQSMKSMFKGGCKKLLMEPWSYDEVNGLIHAMMEMSQCYESSHLSNVLGLELEAAQRVMKERYGEIGGILRHLLSDEMDDYINTRDKASSLKDDLQDLGVFHLPSQSKYHLSFFLRKFVLSSAHSLNFKSFPNVPPEMLEQSNDIYEYQFLSEKSLTMYRNSAKTPSEIQLMERFGLDYQVAEYIIKTNLRPGWESLPKDIRRDGWEWCVNCTPFIYFLFSSV